MQCWFYWWKRFMKNAIEMASGGMIYILSRVGRLCVTYRRGLDGMIGFIDTLFTQLRTTGRILTTIYDSRCNFKSHMESSFHSLIRFLPLFCNCQFRRLDSIQFLCCQAHIPAGWRLETRLTLSTEFFFITILHGPHRKHSFSIVKKAFLQRRCIATEVIRLLLAYSLPRECVYRVVA
jgi:hypothetical protein